MPAATTASAKTLARGATRLSKRLVVSYVWDWICILGIAGIGGAFNRVKSTNHRSFVLQDPSISYPYLPDTVSPTVLIIVGLVAPGIITLLITFLLVPGSAAPAGTPKALIWRRKLWEWNTAWMGLGLALASAFMATEGLKDLAGKPRPHMLALCKPDINQIAQYQVGGLGTTLGGAVPVMVDYGICTETDPHELRNMFASWPSGHSSFSWAGLLYLSLWTASKFAVIVPFLHPSLQSIRGQIRSTFDPAMKKIDRESESTEYQDQNDPEVLFHNVGNPPRNQAAAPPVYLLLLAVFLPVGTALFIAVSRWFDYHHHGFDIISGSLIGAFTAFFSFRYYHMPIRRGSGWSWGARTRGRAFWLGVGKDTYVGEEGWATKKDDIELVEEETSVLGGKQVAKPGTSQSQGTESLSTPGQHAV